MILLGTIEVAVQRLDMIRAPVRVRVAASRISCKQCGREYTTGDLASLMICESCGSELARSGLAVETVQHHVDKQRPVDHTSSSTLDVAKLAARISVTRYELRPGNGSMQRDTSHAIHAIPATRALVAAWIKVA